MKLGQIIEITWIDSHHPVNEGWMEPDRVVWWTKNNCPQLCKTIGYFFAYIKDEIIVFQSRQGEDILNPMVIPRGCIKKIESLKKLKKSPVTI